jgi:SPP1 gp7 family putative phage head morphogenesis protein
MEWIRKAQNEWKAPNNFSADSKRLVEQIENAYKVVGRHFTPETLATLNLGSLSSFLDSVDLNGLNIAQEKIDRVLYEQAKYAGQTTFDNAGINTNLLFDAIDQRAVDYAFQQSAQLVTNITDELRQTIQTTIAEATNGGLTVAQTASRIRTNLPLTTRDANAVNSFRDKQYDKFVRAGVNPVKAQEKADAKAEKYSDKLTRQRAKTIARTEIVRAANEGRYAGWQEGVKGGYVDAQSLKEWIAEPDACPDCAPLDSEIVKWDETFSNGESMPPYHPNCRCSAEILPPDYADTAFVDSPMEAPPTEDQQVQEVVPEAEPEISLGESPQISDILDLTDVDAVKNAFQSVYGVQQFAGQQIEINKVRILGDILSGEDIKITHSCSVTGFFIHPETGERGGVFTRIFMRNADGSLKVAHSYLEVEKAFKGQGISSEFSKFSEAWYKQTGISQISISAGMSDGAYTWAKAGYEWAEKPEALMHDIYAKFKGIEQGDSEAVGIAMDLRPEIVTKLRGLWTALKEGDWKSSDYPKPSEIALLQEPKIKGLPFGKWLLKDADWRGIKNL